MRTQRPFWLPGLGVILALLTACGTAQSTTPPEDARASHVSDQSADSGAGLPPLSIRLEASRIIEFLSPSIMCEAAGLVADAAISQLGPSHWNTADGTRPASVDEDTAVKKGYQIVTALHFSRIKMLLDRRHKPTTEFASLGGTVGRDHYSMDPFPRLTAGRRYLIVFSAGLDAGVGVTQALLLAYNAFPIDAQEMVLLIPASAEQGHVTQEVRLPLSEIARQLTSCPPRS